MSVPFSVLDKGVCITVNENAVLITGYAKLPSNITAEIVYDTLVLAVLFDKRTGIVIDAEASMVTALSRNFVSALLTGYNLSEGPDGLIHLFDTHYLGGAKKALETAIRMVCNRYQDYRATQQATY